MKKNARTLSLLIRNRIHEIERIANLTFRFPGGFACRLTAIREIALKILKEKESEEE